MTPFHRYPFFLILMFTALVHITINDCTSQCTNVQGSTAGNPCRICYSQCQDDTYTINSCQSYQENCNTVNRGGCRNTTVAFTSDQQCLENCCDGQNVESCVENFTVRNNSGSDNATLEWWAIALIVVGILFVLIAVVCCLYWKKRREQSKSEKHTDDDKQRDSDKMKNGNRNDRQKFNQKGNVDISEEIISSSGASQAQLNGNIQMKNLAKSENANSNESKGLKDLSSKMRAFSVSIERYLKGSRKKLEGMLDSEAKSWKLRGLRPFRLNQTKIVRNCGHYMSFQSINPYHQQMVRETLKTECSFCLEIERLKQATFQTVEWV